ncbi:MAG: DUF2793 domain-containing protein [Planctomycetota bacterium]
MGLTPKLRLFYVPEGGHRAEDALNAGMLLSVDPGRMIGVEAKQNDPPGSPTDGDVWIIGEAPTGDWAGQDENALAYRLGGAWVFLAPFLGLVAHDADLSVVDFRVWNELPDNPDWTPVHPRHQPGTVWALTGLRDGEPMFSAAKFVAALPNATTLVEPHGLIGLDTTRIVTAKGSARSPGGAVYPLPAIIPGTGSIGFSVTENNVSITTDFDASGWNGQVNLVGYLLAGAFGPSKFLGIMRGTTSQAVLKYDPTANSWANGANFIQNHQENGTSTHGAAGTYCSGDSGGTLAAPTPFTRYNAGDSFTSRTNRPTASVNAPCGEGSTAGTVVWFGSTTGSSSSHKYDEDTWTAILDILDAYNRGVATMTLSNQIFVGFGNDQSALRRYVITSDGWSSAGASHPNGNAIYDSAYFPMNAFSDCHVAGGRTSISGSATTQHHSYNITSEAWTARLSVPAEVKYAGGAHEPLNARGYITSGTNLSDTPITTTRTYAVDTWITVSEAPSARGEVHGQFAVIERP